MHGRITGRHERARETTPGRSSLDDRPPGAETGRNLVVDVEDVSTALMTLGDGVPAGDQQCHVTPDHGRDDTVTGTESRFENSGDAAGGVERVGPPPRVGDREHPIGGVAVGHEDADLLTTAEFPPHVLAHVAAVPGSAAR